MIDTLAFIIERIPVVVAPVVLMIFSLVSAYVFRFGLPRTGINFDYVLFALATVIALVAGGAI